METDLDVRTLLHRGGADAPAGSVADPLAQARLLAAMLSRPLSGTELARRSAEPGVPEAVDALVLAGSARRTPDGGLALDGPRRSAALDALARDLRL